jgi:hypothetical protein
MKPTRDARFHYRIRLAIGASIADLLVREFNKITGSAETRG